MSAWKMKPIIRHSPEISVTSIMTISTTSVCSCSFFIKCDRCVSQESKQVRHKETVNWQLADTRGLCSCWLVPLAPEVVAVIHNHILFTLYANRLIVKCTVGSPGSHPACTRWVHAYCISPVCLCVCEAQNLNYHFPSSFLALWFHVTSLNTFPFLISTFSFFSTYIDVYLPEILACPPHDYSSSI